MSIQPLYYARMVGQPDPDPGDGFRDVFEQPYDEHAFWNVALSDAATYDPPTISSANPKTHQLHNGSTSYGGTGAGSAGGTELNYNSWTVVKADGRASDPDGRIEVVPSTNYPNGSVLQTINVKVPAGISLPGGYDKHLWLYDETTGIGHMLYAAVAYSPTVLRTHYYNAHTAYGHGLTNGSIASAVTFAPTIITATELLAASQGDEHAIGHVLGMGIPKTILKPTPTSADGLVSTISGVAEAVWPARRKDGSHVYAELGAIPMGTCFAIPPTVDVTTLGLTPVGLALARNLQDYGTCVLIQADNRTLRAEYRPDVPGHATRCEQARTAWGTLRPLLRYVRNANFPGAINANREPLDWTQIQGGPGTRRRPLALPLRPL